MIDGRKCYRYMVWDWNGTLLDDAAYTVKVMNTILPQYGLKEIPDADAYRAVFEFPVIKYYENLGIDFSRVSFDEVAQIFIRRYDEMLIECALFHNTAEVLQAVKARGIQQVILSATRNDLLQRQIAHFGIGRYVDTIMGIGDIYAASKVHLAVQWVTENKIDPKSVLMAGDSAHDYEVACAVGFDCVLIGNGHQGRSRLKAGGAHVLEDLSQVLDLL